MTQPYTNPVPPPVQGESGVSWLVALGMALLLPLLEWGGVKTLRVTGVALTTSSFWVATLVVNMLYLLMLLLVAGRVMKSMWSVPGLRDVGLTLGALVAGWFAIPMVQYAVAPLVAPGSSASEAAPSLVPGNGLEILLLALVSIAGSVAQELVYRGLLWQRIAGATGSTRVALVGSSLVFGLLFIRGGIVTYLSVGVAWGMVAGSLYMITRRLSAVILLNALNMFLTYAVLFRYLV